MKIVILGGGISGLSAAFYARKKYREAQITLIEKAARLGGSIQTSFGGGFLFEQGPRTFAYKSSSNLLGLIEEAGLREHLIDSDQGAARRFLWHRGKLRSVASFLPTWILSLLREPFIAKGNQEDESIYDFALRRLGLSMTNTIIDAIVLGIYAGDIHKLSVRSCFPSLHTWEREKGSLVLGALSSLFSKKKRVGLFTLKPGMQVLIQTLSDLSKAEIRLTTCAEEIRRDGVVANGIFFPADLIVSALSGSAIGHLTGLWKDFAEVDLGVVHLAFKENILSQRGFGYLVPTQEKENLLGMIWDSAIFPQQGRSGETRITAIMRTQSLDGALECVQRHLNRGSGLPVFSFAHTAKGAIPQFHVGYAKRLKHFEEEVKQRYPSLLLLGNYLRGVSVDSCVALAQRTF